MPPEPRASSFVYAGSCRVGLEVDRDLASCGETFTGRILLRGGRTPQRIERTAACLGGRDSDLESFVYDRNCWNGLLVNPGEVQRLEFTLSVPDRVQLEWQKRVWVAARAERDMEVTAGTEVRILPPHCFVELSEALAAAARVPDVQWTTIGGGDGVAAQFTPVGPARALFDGLRLEMFRTGPVLYGELEINPREYTLRDRLRAATGADRCRFSFSFRSANSDEVRNFFGHCLRPYVDAVRQLPIPSGANLREAASLPRPSARGEEPQE
jgi:hypothetical protein